MLLVSNFAHSTSFERHNNPARVKSCRSLMRNAKVTSSAFVERRVFWFAVICRSAVEEESEQNMAKLNLCVLFVAAAQIHSVTPVLHTLKYLMTASSQIPNIPDYFEVGYVDDVPISRYDSKSRKAKPKQDWMNKITADDPHYWERQTQNGIAREQINKVNIETAKERFNQTGGVHMFQVMSGCEWDDETDEVDGWEHYSYDGEAFISLEVKTMRWIAAHPQAFVTKLKWDRNELWNLNKKHYFTEICPSYLKKYLTNGRDFLMRTELPTVSLLQKTPSSPVTCHATGFYPSAAALFWRNDGEELHEDTETGETLRNHDGTFQMTADLKAEVTDEAEGRYECVFQLSGVADDIVVKLERRSIRSNARIRAVDADSEPASEPAAPTPASE
ncbi:major histocompatibility complex class I-related gene protein-like isoform X2 [Phyllopteryx taeniolatus]|uniref:major histocompatibility complex class I-related gene protein-like isoform X2 n=1 Tax=Phyllopteryx taeniolatus TaxID=161469 RepID=UPI002AD2386E|nr:major histocompatibility complex class I-related gene protein-like isoform X2 [Phyllopteryx taeniolatus]